MDITVAKQILIAEQCIKTRGIPLSLQSSMRDWKPVNEDDIYVVLVLFMLMGILQNCMLIS
jgi:hypothetical protein